MCISLYSVFVSKLSAEIKMMRTVLAACFRAPDCPFKPKSYKQSGFEVGICFMALCVLTTCNLILQSVTILVKNAKSHITSKQLQVLLGFAEEDIYDSSRQATAFGLLKVFLWNTSMGFVSHWNGRDFRDLGGSV